jgi:hypothetical protein
VAFLIDTSILLVAVCHVYGLSHVLTFNVPHFSRLATFGPGVTVVHPASV